ncbi:MAG: sigma-70 family RNA polymerase sigma factor [Oscillospiraceae bacterium]|jgi:RNA polymerase sigma-70 factor (ECF subfamily)|nr:sigma-70 family RNA polymerase sigma factor [Oscillospiraceae bacterium]
MEETAAAVRRDTQGGALTDDKFVALLKGCETVLYKMAYQYVRNEDDALEMVSETAYRAYKSRKALKNPEHFRTWVTRILINACLSHLRRTRRIAPWDAELEDGEASSGAVQPAAPPNGIDDTLVVEDALARLRPAYKTVLLLRYYQEMSVQETARVMGVPEGTVKTYTARALAEARKWLKEEDFRD